MYNLMADSYPPRGTKFIALYNDGSGADMFMHTDGGEYIGCSGEECTEENLDHYLLWALVPNDYEFWYEVANDAP